MEAVTPLVIVKIVLTVVELFPETVKRFAPGPVKVMLAVIAGRVLSRVMVPVAVMLIVPGGLALAIVIASRSDPVPLSFVFVTVIVAPEALPEKPRLHNTRQKAVNSIRLRERT